MRKWSKSIAFLFPPLMSHKMAAWMRMRISDSFTDRIDQSSALATNVIELDQVGRCASNFSSDVLVF